MGPATSSESLSAHSCVRLSTWEIKQHFYCNKDTVFKLIHVFRLGGISVAGRKVEGIILQVVMDGVIDQSFSIKEEMVLYHAVWVQAPQYSITHVLKINWPRNSQSGCFCQCGLTRLTSTHNTNLTRPWRRHTQHGSPQAAHTIAGRDR